MYPTIYTQIYPSIYTHIYPTIHTHTIECAWRSGVPPSAALGETQLLQALPWRNLFILLHTTIYTACISELEKNVLGDAEF